MSVRNLKAFLLAPHNSIRDALECVQKNEKGIALIVDEERRLLGTVTDGDTRRALLRGMNLDSRIDQVMKTNPIFIAEDLDEKAIRSVLSISGLRQIPVLNASRQVIDIRFPYEAMEQQRIRAVIMAGGFGKRLHPLTKDKPKPLLKMGNRAIIETIILQLSNQGIRDITVSVNFKKEQVKEYLGDGSQWNAHISFVEEEKILGTLGAVGLLDIQEDEVLLVINGDIYTDIDYQAMARFHSRTASECTVAVRNIDYEFPFGVVNLEDHAITGIFEKPELKFNINAGIYLINANLVEKIPRNAFLNATDFIKDSLLTKGHKVLAFLVTEDWIDIGRPSQLELARDIFGKKGD